MGWSLLQLELQLTRLLIHCVSLVFPKSPRVICLVTTSQLLPEQLFLTLDSISITMPCLITMCMWQLLLRFLVSSILTERRILMMSQQAWRLSSDLPLIKPLLFWHGDTLSAVTLSQPDPKISNRISIAVDCILCMAKGSITRIMVLQSLDCCWYFICS